MRAIILAAGVGCRLAPLTDTKPKTMVEVNGVPMLGGIMTSLGDAGVHDIIVCTGYRSDIIRNYCQTSFPDGSVRFVENVDYLTTNNMYSLYLAREYIEGDCLILNADLFFSPEIIELLCSVEGSAFAVDPSQYLEEAMKVTTEGGVITGIAKTFTEAEAFGCSIDIYKITQTDTAMLVHEMVHIIETEKDRNQWTEVMLHRLLASGRLRPTPACIGEWKWFEIDTFDDLFSAELMFNPHLPGLMKKKLFFLDRDGTLTIGGKVLPGACHFLETLRKSNIDFYVLTNNSSQTPQEHLHALHRAGLDLTQDEILVSTDVAAEYLAAHKLTDVYWLATEEVGKYLVEHHGLHFDAESPSALLLTYDVSLSYDKLRIASALLRQGVRYFATHADVICPTPAGPVPDVGTFIEMFYLTTGRRPEMVFGKPNRAMVDSVLNRRGLDYSDAVVVGDRLYTDVALADGTEMTSILVLTGETTRDAYEEQPQRADIVIKDLETLAHYL